MTTQATPRTSRRVPWGSTLLRSFTDDPYAQQAEHSYGLDQFTQAPTIREAMRAAGLDWKVQLERIWTAGSDHTLPGEIPDTFATVAVKTDQELAVLGVVGNKYQIIQPRQLAEFADTVVDTTGTEIAGYGVTRDGGWRARSYAVIKFGEVRPPGMPDEATDVFLVISNSYDGSAPFTASLVPYRLVCVNGLRYPIKNITQTWTIRHAGDTLDAIAAARVMVQNATGYIDAFEDDLYRLLGVPMASWAARETVEAIIPVPEPRVDDETGEVTNRRTIEHRVRQRDELHGLWLNSPNIDNVRWTGWGFVNAYAEWMEWGTGARRRRLDPMTRMVESSADTQLGRVRDLVLAR